MKNTIIEIKNLINGIKSRTDTPEKRSKLRQKKISRKKKISRRKTKGKKIQREDKKYREERRGLKYM